MSQLDELLQESGLADDHALAALLAPLAEQPPAPAPSRELAAVFAGVRLVVTAPSRAARAARAAAAAGVAAVLGVGGTGLAAAANTLPAPLQHRVSDFSHRYLPFDFPRPGERPGGEHGTVPAPVLGAPEPGAPAPHAQPAGPPLELRRDQVGPHAAAATAATRTPSAATGAGVSATPAVEVTESRKDEGKGEGKGQDKQPKGEQPKGEQPRDEQPRDRSQGGDAKGGEQTPGTGDEGDSSSEAVPLALRPPSTTPVTPPADDPDAGSGGDTRSAGKGAQGGAKGRGAANGGGSKGHEDKPKASSGHRGGNAVDALVEALPLVDQTEPATDDRDQS